MLFLYLGYLLSQSYSVALKLYTEDISLLALVFSIVVFLVCSLLPVSGYLVAKLFKPKQSFHFVILMASGLIFGLFENMLFYFDILVYGQGLIANAIVFACSFALAFMPLKREPQQQAA